VEYKIHDIGTVLLVGFVIIIFVFFVFHFLSGGSVESLLDKDSDEKAEKYNENDCVCGYYVTEKTQQY
jgi:ABC-type dipeptide/oligopeptide/nickel transport system permease component